MHDTNPAYVQLSGVHMGIALLGMTGLFTPLQSLTHRWMPSRRRDRLNAPSGLRYVGIRPSPAKRPAPPASARPLRVVRTIDARQPRHPARVVISGRMADVCAELDRLAALEAAGVERGN
jgi:hypothetical protein